MNVFIAILFIAVLLMTGREVLKESEPVVGTVLPDKPAAEAGLQPGDRITAVDDEAIRTWDDLRLAISMHPGTAISVVYTRDGETRRTMLVPERIETDYGVAGQAGIQPYLSSTIGRVHPGTAAAEAGLRTGDQIVAADGNPVEQWSDLDSAFTDDRTTPIPLTIARAGARVELVLRPRQGEEPYPGFLPPTELQKLGAGAAVRESLAQNWKMVKYTFAVIGRLFQGQGSMKDFSGPVSIARISGEMLRTGWQALVFLMAMISLQLGILNLLPIPVLDGGHIFILLLEGAAGRDLSLTTKERLFRIGFAFLAALMIVVLYNDVIQNILIMRRG
jgi:regulator of sigma E protease